MFSFAHIEIDKRYSVTRAGGLSRVEKPYIRHCCVESSS